MRREHWYNCIKISVESDDDLYKIGVVPYAGTWIETVSLKTFCDKIIVVPYAGTWIETVNDLGAKAKAAVVPYAGTWIETAARKSELSHQSCRSLRGNVD